MSDKKGQVKWLKQPSPEDLEAFQRAVGPKYSQFSESIRRFAPGGLTCSMFCGGKNCRYDNPTKFKDNEMAIQGLYSSWITDEILATSRPSSFAVKEYNVINQFKKQGIKSIINLQHPGEHASCGFGLQPSGFSYNPQEFMDGDVFYYNYGWNDYGVRSLHSILDIVKVMDFAVSDGKVAVHCHAGLGRTGVVIACFMVFRDRMEADDAIHLVRKTRPKAIQTRGQIGCVKDFAKYLKPMRTVFCLTLSDENVSKKFTLDEFLLKQKHILHGEEERKLRYVPKIIFVICQRILELARVTFDLQSAITISRKGLAAGKGSVLQREEGKTIINAENLGSHSRDEIPDSDDVEDDTWNTHKRSAEEALDLRPNEGMNIRHRSQSLCHDIHQIGRPKNILPKCKSDENVNQLTSENCFSHNYDSGSVTISEAASEDITNGSDVDCSPLTRLTTSIPEESQENKLALGVFEQNGIVTRGGKLKPLQRRDKENRKKKGKKGKKVNLNEDVVQEDQEKVNPNNLVDSNGPREDSFSDSLVGNLTYTAIPLEMETIVQYLSSRTSESQVLLKVDRYKRKLNTSNLTWSLLQEESDIKVLGSLLWAWLEHLKEPVLKKEQLQSLNTDLEMEDALNNLNRNSRKTFECLLYTFSKICPTSTTNTQKLFRRLAIALTRDKMFTSVLRSDVESQRREDKHEESQSNCYLYAGNGQVCLDFSLNYIARKK